MKRYYESYVSDPYANAFIIDVMNMLIDYERKYNLKYMAPIFDTDTAHYPNGYDTDGGHFDYEIRLHLNILATRRNAALADPRNVDKLISAVKRFFDTNDVDYYIESPMFSSETIYIYFNAPKSEEDTLTEAWYDDDDLFQITPDGAFKITLAEDEYEVLTQYRDIAVLRKIVERQTYYILHIGDYIKIWFLDSNDDCYQLYKITDITETTYYLKWISESDVYNESLNRRRINEATEAKDIEKFRDVDFNYDYPVRRETGPGVQFDSLSSKFRAFLKNICQRNGWELVEYSKNYYYCTAYIKDENDNYIYINLGDVRYMFGKKWIDQILYRKTADNKDSGSRSHNNYASIIELERALQKLFDDYDFAM